MVATSLATLLSNSPPACNNDMVCLHEVAYLISFNKWSCDGNEYQMKIWTLRMETRVSIFIDIGAVVQVC